MFPSLACQSSANTVYLVMTETFIKVIFVARDAQHQCCVCDGGDDDDAFASLSSPLMCRPRATSAPPHLDITRMNTKK